MNDTTATTRTTITDTGARIERGELGLLRLTGRSFAQDPAGDAQLIAWDNTVDPTMISVCALADGGAEQVSIVLDIAQAEALVVQLQDLVNGARRARREAAIR